MLKDRGKEAADFQEQFNELIKANADFDNLLINAEIGALYLDGDLHIRKITPIMAKNTGLKLADTGRSLEQVDFIDGYASLSEDVICAMKEKRLIEREILRDGQTWVLRITPYYLTNNTVAGAIIVLFDITRRLQTVRNEMKRAYFQVEQEKEKLNVIAEMSGDMLFEYDIERDVMDYTRQREGVVNEDRITKDYVKTIKKSGYIHPDDGNILKEFCEELCIGKKHIYAEMRKKYRDGRYHWIEIEGTTLYDKQGQPIKVIGRTNNIDERKAKEEYFQLCSERDSLTGLYNHQVVIDKIRARLAKIRPGQSGWLVILDVDNFKQINDANGHLVGDAVLCMIADELKNLFKSGLTGRIGGDEFIVFIEDISREELKKLLTALNSTVKEVYRDREKNMEVSCSMGVVPYSREQKDFDILFQWADYALYRVKQENKNGYYIVEPRRSEQVPDIGYLREEREEYSRKETVIHSVDELILFTLELLNNVPDYESGLKMASDRICSFFEIDDVVYIEHEGGTNKKRYHWSRRTKRQSDVDVLPESREAWDFIFRNFDDTGLMVLRNKDIQNMPGEQVGSVLFVRSENGEEKQGSIAYVDRQRDRDWKEEKEPLSRLAGIIFKHLQQFYESEREKNEREFQINYDTVTGLPQYPKFIMLSAQYMKEHSLKNYYFVYSDFSNFQYMNELYGYTEGDKILKTFAEQLSRQENGIYFTRVTSDHFVGLLTGKDEETVRKAYQEEMVSFCRQINKKYDQSNLVLVSGLSSVNNVQEWPSSAIDRANIARKYGKGSASTAVIVYNQEIKDKNEAEKAVSANMVTALGNEEFKAWLQPKVSLKTGKIVGAEALVRWQRPDGSQMFPDSFIPIFEKNGFITKLDFAVLDQVMDYLRAAMDAGEPVVPVSVNFSRRHNEAPGFVDKILKRLKERNVPTRYIEVEITESVFMLDLSTLKDNLDKLKENGIAVSIDDFGSGYSSLNVLANVEADVIKLDKKFLTYAGSDSKAPVFVKYLIRMMKRMGYQVIAEGVETEEQLALLRNSECDMVQGFYYARPMSIFDFRKFLKEFNG